jgi:multisubunit Na+/H+ antiporter MnhB subunit
LLRYPEVYLVFLLETVGIYVIMLQHRSTSPPFFVRKSPISFLMGISVGVGVLSLFLYILPEAWMVGSPARGLHLGLNSLSCVLLRQGNSDIVGPGVLAPSSS